MNYKLKYTKPVKKEDLDRMKKMHIPNNIDVTKNIPELNEKGTQEDFERFMTITDNEIPIEEVYKGR